MEERNSYVYTLTHVETSKVFYVGCGTLRVDGYTRYQDHLYKTRIGSPLYVHRKIRSLQAEKQHIKYEVVVTGATHEESRLIEKNMIAAYGLDNLCNLTPGGDGLHPQWLEDNEKYTKETWVAKQRACSVRKKSVYLQSLLDGTELEYESASEAARVLGVNPASLAKVARGKYPSIKQYRVSYRPFKDVFSTFSN